MPLLFWSNLIILSILPYKLEQSQKRLKSTEMFIVVPDVRALTNMHIRAPEAVKKGDSDVGVYYDLESAALYTIKWYRNDEEFYRFVPKESPPSQAFDVPHLEVDVSMRDCTYRGVGECGCTVLGSVAYVMVWRILI
ncbi:hypothetical protein JTB14_025710 [Gonioctena quinquepunctata]|nr:hypothetical protein JTB14_025710 [Gonioctena quinquepunctata]